MTNDDLTPWQNTPLVDALTADGTAGELSGRDAALAAFRSSAHAGWRRGVVRFLGTGGAAVALAGVVGGGVAAAAYTRSLPEPVQSVAHDVFGPIGVPAPARLAHKHHHPATIAAAGVQPTTAAASAAPEPSAAPSTEPSAAASPRSAVAHSPAASPGGVIPAVSASPSTSPLASASPSPTPSPTGPAGDPSTWTMSGAPARTVVHVHQGARVSGTLLDADGQPVADHQVVVRTHTPGTPGWERTAIRRTDSSGSVEAFLANMTENRVVVLGAGDRVHSSPLRIIVRPALTVSARPSADGTSYVVTVSADGGNPGDLVNLVRHTPQGWEQVGQAELDGSSSASFVVQAPEKQKRYVVRLPATRLHAFAAARVVLQPLS